MRGPSFINSSEYVELDEDAFCYTGKGRKDMQIDG